MRRIERLIFGRRRTPSSTLTLVITPAPMDPGLIARELSWRLCTKDGDEEADSAPTT